MASRKSIPERTIKALFGKSRNMCAFPGCGRMMIDEKTDTVLGEIAHIEGVRKTAARHNPNRPKETLNDFDNLILLCHDHHKIIDNKKNGYTVAQVQRMKQKHELQGGIEIGEFEARLARIYLAHEQATRTVKVTRVYNHSPHNEVYGDQTINIYNHPKADPLPDDAIGLDAEKKAYVQHLIARYGVLTKKYAPNATAPSVNLHRAIRKEFSTKALAVPISMFNSLCSFLQKKIDGTIVGKSNRKKGIPNYSPFDEWVKKHII